MKKPLANETENACSSEAPVSFYQGILLDTFMMLSTIDFDTAKHNQLQLSNYRDSDWHNGTKLTLTNSWTAKSMIGVNIFLRIISPRQE